MTTEVTLAVQSADSVQVSLSGGSIASGFRNSPSSEACKLLRRQWMDRQRTHAEKPMSLCELKSFGADLVTALLPTEVSGALRQARKKCHREGSVLRLRLKLASEWEDLPYECLDLGEGVDLLCLDPLVSVYREAGDETVRPSSVDYPLRILVAYANPDTAKYPHLGWLASEMSALYGALCEHSDVRLLPDAVPATLEKALRGFRPHLFHFSGHADRLPTGDVLVTQGINGSTASYVRSDELAQWLAIARTKIVVLSACNTVGIAREAVAKGVSVAIATQMPYRSGAPLTFARSFYAAASHGTPIDEALAEARQALRDRDGDWLAPVLLSSGDFPVLIRRTRPEPLDRGLPHNLPSTDRRLVGRADERLRIRRSLAEEDVRILLITGSAGAGKSRLAREAAREALPTFPGGVWLLDCSELSNDEALFAGLRSLVAPDADDLATVLAGKRTLFVLDGCEKLLDAESMESLQAFLNRAPGVKVIATSRIGQNALKHELRLGPLSGTDDSESIELFRQTALESGFAHFKHGAESDALHTICQNLQGLPLAIILAASRLQYVTIGELAEMVSQSLLRTLSDPRSNGPHASISVVIDASIRLLPKDDLLFLRRLSVFVGSFGILDLTGVHSIDQFGAVNALGRLFHNSVIEATVANGKTRYRLLDAVREYLDAMVQGEEMVADRQHIRHAHALHYALRSESLQKLFAEGKSPEGSDVLWKDLGNLRAALTFAMSERLFSMATTLCACLARIYLEAGLWSDLDDVLRSAEQVVAATDNQTLSAAMLGIGGALASRRGQLELCHSMWERRAAISQDLGRDADRADALIDLASHRFWSADIARIEEYLGTALPVAEAAAKTDLVATVFVLHALVGQRRNDPAEALGWAAKAEALPRPGGTADTYMFVDTNLGRVHMFAGDPAHSIKCYSRVLRAARAGERRHHLAGALIGLSPAYEALGRRGQAARVAVAACQLYAAIGSRRLAEAEAQRERLRSVHPEAISLAEATVKSWAEVADEIID